MRSKFLSVATLLLIATPAFAQEAATLAEAAAKPSLLTPRGGLMFWTLLIFALLFFILRKFAFGPITAAVQAREAALEAAIAAAQADRDAAAKLLAEHLKNIENARSEAQRYIAEGRATAESMKSEMLEATKKQQDEMLERARRDIESEKTKAIDALRKEAIDLALAGASKVIEQNLDDAKNRTLIENYLASIGTR
jgi:F-type H+-transporting ATPase subunit b